MRDVRAGRAEEPVTSGVHPPHRNHCHGQQCETGNHAQATGTFQLHVFREPHLDYANHHILTASDTAAVAALGDAGFAVSALFPDG